MMNWLPHGHLILPYKFRRCLKNHVETPSFYVNERLVPQFQQHKSLIEQLLLIHLDTSGRRGLFVHPLNAPLCRADDDCYSSTNPSQLHASSSRCVDLSSTQYLQLIQHTHLFYFCRPSLNHLQYIIVIAL